MCDRGGSTPGRQYGLKKTVVITGANGYLGKTLVKEIISTRRYNLFILSEDITNGKEIEKALTNIDFDILIHAAALVPSRSPTPEDLLRVNYLGTTNLAKHCTPDTHFIFISSDLVFPSEAGKIWKSDDSPFPPQSTYSMTKAIAEDHLINKTEIEDVAVLRTSMLYGGEGERDNFFQFLGRRLSLGLETEVYTNLYSHPTHVEDLSRFIVSVMDNRRRGIIHACSDEYYNRSELAKIICKRKGFNEKLLHPVPSSNSCETRLEPDEEFVSQIKFRLGE